MLKKILLLAVCVLMLIPLMSVSVSAGESTTYTYTVSVNQEWIRTQDAYLSGRVYLKNFGLKMPNDIFYKDNFLYVSDGENGRIVEFNLETEEITTFGEGILTEPHGIYIDDDDTAYIADPKLGAVVVFDSQRNEAMRIGRPDSFLFNEQSVYQPINVVVTSQKNIFVVGQGSYEGLMQFDKNGVFQGYFAANKRGLTLIETIQEAIYTDEQKDQMISRIPRAIANIDLADRDMIYSVTQGDGKSSELTGETKIQNYLKKHNMSGLNILSRKNSMTEEWNFTDVATGNYGNVYALTSTGLIYEYDSSGTLIFSFGGRALSGNRSGLFTVASAIDVSENGILYVLDREGGFVQTFFPTEFAAVTHQAISNLNSGDYEESKRVWSTVLKLNGNSSIAHLGLGKALLHLGEYSEAMEHFKICGNKEYYSVAFWEIRSTWLNKNIPWILIAAAVVVVLKILADRFNIIKKKEKSKNVSATSNGLISDIFLIKDMIFHPIDTYYYIKHGKRASVLSATIVYILFFVIFVFDMLLRGYLFSNMTVNSIPIYFVPLMFFIPLILWIFGNNMVSSINEGEGTFKSIYISSAYMVSPYIVFAPIAIALTYVLSLNEQFIVTMLWTVGVVWSFVLVILELMEIHNYTLPETLKNLLFILFFMIMAVVTIAIIYLIWTQVFGYLIDVFGEVKYRIFGY